MFGVAWGKRMSPVTLILPAGAGAYCGAVNSLLALFDYDQLQGMFLWGTGRVEPTGLERGAVIRRVCWWPVRWRRYCCAR